MCSTEPMPRPVLLLQLTILTIIEVEDNIDNLADVPSSEDPTRVREKGIGNDALANIEGRDTDIRSEDKNTANMQEKEPCGNAH